MNDDEIKAVIQESIAFIVKDGTVDARALFHLCKEIERQTRQRAHASAQAVANAISRGIDVRDVLQKHADL